MEILTYVGVGLRREWIARPIGAAYVFSGIRVGLIRQLFGVSEGTFGQRVNPGFPIACIEPVVRDRIALAR